LNKKDWGGLKFKIMKEQGECIDIIFIKHSHSQQRHKEIYLKPHDQADGSSAFAQVLNKIDKENITELNTIKTEQKPSLPKRLFYIYKHLQRQKPVHYNWKKYYNNQKGVSKGVSYFILNKEQSLLIEKKAKEKKSNVNSLFLSALDKATSELLENKNQKRVWMLPVNIRTKKFAKELKHNYVTTLSIILENNRSDKEIYNQIKSMMKSGIIWGGQIVANAPKYIGENRLRKMSQNIKSPYIGLLSNMGQWDSRRPKNDEHWVMAAPVTRFCPVASILKKWNGQYSFSCQLHPTLSQNLQETDRIMKEVLKDLDLETNTHLIDWNSLQSNSVTL
jgi:hypothetical protein